MRIAEGPRRWLRCAGEALHDRQVIGMPSRAVDEAWHRLILCTERYASFCDDAYGRFLHHYSEGDGAGGGDSIAEIAPVHGRLRTIDRYEVGGP